jgi:small subunit ribosomal protein S3
LKKITKKEIQINISEIKRPELDSVIVANTVASQIEGRISYRRAIKTSIASAMRIGAEGIKIMISGRLGGAEMARREQYKEGRIPLHTFRADIDYATAEAHTTYGRIGIKVWICKGDVYGRPDLVPDAPAAKMKPSMHRGGGPKGDHDRDRDHDRGGRDRGPRNDGGKPRGPRK